MQYPIYFKIGVLIDRKRKGMIQNAVSFRRTNVDTDQISLIVKIKLRKIDKNIKREG